MSESKYQRALEQIIEMSESRFTLANHCYDHGQVFIAAVEIASQALGTIADRRVRAQKREQEEQFISRLPRPGSIVSLEGVSIRVCSYDANQAWFQVKRIVHAKLEWGKEENLDMRMFFNLLNKDKTNE